MSDVPAQDVDLLAAAIELPVAERTAYLDRACSGDPDLRQRVEGLLKEHDDLGDFPKKRPSKGTAQGGPRAIGEKPGATLCRSFRWSFFREISQVVMLL